MNPESRADSHEENADPLASSDIWIPVVVTPTGPLLRTGDQLGSYDGAGTLEMLEVVTILVQADITCCMVGIVALRYFGAWRVVDASANYAPLAFLTDCTAALGSVRPRREIRGSDRAIHVTTTQ